MQVPHDPAPLTTSSPEGNPGTITFVESGSEDDFALAEAASRTLVSNTGQTANATGYALTTSIAKRAQGFTTGADALGYRLTSIGVRFGTIGASADPASELTATLAKSSSGDPGDAICTLTPPGSYTADSVNTYAAPDDCGALSSGTSYFVVIERHTLFTGTIQLAVTAAVDEDSGGAEGWSITDKRNYFVSGGWDSSNGPYMIEAEGSPVTQPTLVSNTGQTTHGDGYALLESFPKFAQAFTTGAHADGYLLASVGVGFQIVSNTATAASQHSATINTESSGNPGSAVCTLTAPDSFTSAAVNTYTAPGDCLLAASTTYFVVLERQTFVVAELIGIDKTTTDDEDSGGADGWSIAHKVHKFSQPDSAWQTTSSEALQIALRGKANVVNSPAEGAVVITGLVQTGETLTADTQYISDADGLTGVSYSYQWILVEGTTETDISGANASTYTVLAAQSGKSFKLRVEFSDDASNNESLTSIAAAPDTFWRATLTVGDLTSLGFQDIGYAHRSYGSLLPVSHGWGGSDFEVRTIDWGVSLTLFWAESVDAGAPSTVGREQAETWILVLGGDEFRITDAPYFLNNPARPQGGRDRYSGTVQWYKPGLSWSEGETLEVALKVGARVTHPWWDELTASPFSPLLFTVTEHSTDQAEGVGYDSGGGYGDSALDITTQFFYSPGGATQQMYPDLLAVRADGTLALQLSIRVDNEDNAVTPSASHFDGLVMIVGGERFELRDAAFSDVADIHTAAPGADQVLKTVEFTWANSGLSWSDEDEIVVFLDVDNIPATGAPAISGTAQVGRTLSVDLTGIGDINGVPTEADAFSYQWLRVSGGTESPIAGATGASYTLLAADEGHTIKVQVTFTDLAAGQRYYDEGFEETLASAETATVAAASGANVAATGAPSIIGTAQVGRTLSVNRSGISDGNGVPASASAFSYQWQRVSGGTPGNIAGATGATYTLVAADEGKRVQVVVSFDDNGGFSESLTSAQTAVIAAAAPEEEPAEPEEELSETGRSLCFRTPQVRFAIVDAVVDQVIGPENATGEEWCGDITPEQLAEVEVLNLGPASPRLQQIEPGDFAGLSGLRVLALGFNDIGHLRPGTFRGLGGIEELDLGYNSISQIDAGAFSGLATLKRLWLDDNRISSLPPGIFNDLTALYEVALGYNGSLGNLNANLFPNLQRNGVARTSSNPLKLHIGGSGVSRTAAICQQANIECIGN